MKHIIIKHSGLCERLDCSVAEVITLFKLWLKGFTREIPMEEGWSGFDIFRVTILQMHGDLSSITELLEREAVRTEEYRLEIQIKKSAGTYDSWLKEITEENAKCDLKSFFDTIDKFLPPIKYGGVN